MNSSFDPARTPSRPKRPIRSKRSRSNRKDRSAKAFVCSAMRGIVWFFVDAQGAEHVGVRPIRSVPDFGSRPLGITLRYERARAGLPGRSHRDCHDDTMGSSKRSSSRREFMPTVLRIVRIHGHTSPAGMGSRNGPGHGAISTRRRGCRSCFRSAPRPDCGHSRRPVPHSRLPSTRRRRTAGTRALPMTCSPGTLT